LAHNPCKALAISITPGRISDPHQRGEPERTRLAEHGFDAIVGVHRHAGRFARIGTERCALFAVIDAKQQVLWSHSLALDLPHDMRIRRSTE